MELKYDRNNGNKFDFILNSMVLSLGNQTTIKCLYDDDGQVKYTKCWARILDELIYLKDKNDPYLNLFNKIIQSYHNIHLCSCKSALALTILLWKTLNLKLDVLNEPNQEETLLNYLDSIFNHSLDRLMNSEKVKRLPVIENNRKSSSRHQIVYLDKNSQQTYKSLIHSFCRCQSEYSDIIWEIFVHNNFKISLDKISFIIDYSLNVSENVDNQLYVIQSGILFELDQNQQLNSDYNTLIFDASLVYNYTHLGYNKDLKCNKFVKSEARTTTIDQKTSWLVNLKEILIKNKINLLIVSGNVDKEFYSFCLKQQIVVIMCLDADKFKLIKNYFELATILVYIEDFTEDCIFKTRIEKMEYKNYACIRKYDDDSSEVISVLIKKDNKRFLLKNQMKMFIEELKHNIKRFENVLTDKTYFVNTGACIENDFANLVKSAVCSKNDDEVIHTIAKEILNETFSNYFNLVKSNTRDNNNDDETINDDTKSKIEAWKLALYINKLFLNIDFTVFV